MQGLWFDPGRGAEIPYAAGNQAHRPQPEKTVMRLLSPALKSHRGEPSSQQEAHDPQPEKPTCTEETQGSQS